MTGAGSEGPLSSLSLLLGASQPALRLLCTILLGYPLAFIHRFLLFEKSATLQHLFFITCGLALGIFNYGFDILHSVFCVLVMYFILVTIGGTFKSVLISFFFLMGYLIYGYYITGTDEYDIKWSMPQCVLTLRLIGLAYDVYDGQKSEEELSKDQKTTALKKCPSLLEVAGHTYFFGGFMVGPQFPMKRYIDFIEGRFPGKDYQSGEPSCVTAGFRRLGLGIGVLAFYQIGNMIIPDKSLLSDAFMEYPLLLKLLIIGIWGKIFLYKYMACWLISEGSCIITGMTFNGKDKNGNNQWDGCANVKLWDFSVTTTFEGIIKSFNINTNLWVAQYVFKRLKFLGNRLLSQAGSLIFLAIWHGLHSGYYVCFVSEFIVMYFEKDMENILEVRLPKLKAFLVGGYWRKIFVLVFLKIYVDIFMGYCLVSFAMLSYSKYMKVYSSVYFIGHFYYAWPFMSPIVKMLIPKARVRDEKPKTQ